MALEHFQLLLFSPNSFCVVQVKIKMEGSSPLARVSRPYMVLRLALDWGKNKELGE